MTVLLKQQGNGCLFKLLLHLVVVVVAVNSAETVTSSSSSSFSLSKSFRQPVFLFVSDTAAAAAVGDDCW